MMNREEFAATSSAYEDEISYVDPSMISPLTGTQEKMLSLLPIIPSTLSIFGSLTIVSMVITSKRRRSSSRRRSNSNGNSTLTPYKRLLLGMSICDAIMSISLPFWAFLLPNKNDENDIRYDLRSSNSGGGGNRIWAYGNQSTCNIIGFFNQFAFSSVLYNGMLSYYYLLAVRFGIKDKSTTMKYVEPIMHLFSVGFPLLTATLGTIKGYYSDVEIGLTCWVDDYPRNCGYGVGQSGEKCLSPMIGWIFGGSIMFFVLLSIAINNLVIYLFVRRTIYRGRRRNNTSSTLYFQRQQQQQHAASGLEVPSTPAKHSSTMDKSPDVGEDNNTVTSFATAKDQQSNKRRRNRSQQTAFNNDDPQLRRIQAVATQGFLYVAAFLLSYVIAVTLRIFEGLGGTASDEGRLYPLLVLQAIFMPMQGFFNLLVYVRPNYLRVRRDFKDETRLWSFRRALHGSDIEPQQTASSKLRGSSIFSSNNNGGRGRHSFMSNTAFFVVDNNIRERLSFSSHDKSMSNWWTNSDHGSSPLSLCGGNNSDHISRAIARRKLSSDQGSILTVACKTTEDNKSHHDEQSLSSSDDVSFGVSTRRGEPNIPSDILEESLIELTRVDSEYNDDQGDAGNYLVDDKPSEVIADDLKVGGCVDYNSDRVVSESMTDSPTSRTIAMRIGMDGTFHTVESQDDLELGFV